MAIYKVRISAPAINEEITTPADNPEQARERGVASALQRQASTATVTVEQLPDPSTGATAEQRLR